MLPTSGATAWSFHGREYSVRAAGGLGGYEACMITVQRVIDAASVDQCEEVPTRKIAGGMLFTPRYNGL